MIQVEVVFAKPKEQIFKTVMLQNGACVQDALLKAGLAEQSQDDHLAYGIFGKVVSLNQLLSEGDRVEIYRPLKLDPKAKRELIIKKKALRKPGLISKKN